MKRFLTAFAIFGTVASAAPAAETPGHDEHGHEPIAGGVGFLEPFEHLHFSRLGTPLVHSFLIEPAFTGRDLFIDHRFRSGDEPSEHEFELELEWAFTRRLGIIVELPYAFVDEGGGETAAGFGDLAIVPRALLMERDRFILTAQVEIVAPTGSSGFGGETAIAPGVVAWFDLGDWWTLNSQVAVEHVFDEDGTEFVFGFGLVKTIGHTTSASNASHGHASTAGFLNLHLEITGTAGLAGEDEGVVNAEALIGFSYGISRGIDVRVGYEFPLSSPNEFDRGITSGFVWHF